MKTPVARSATALTSTSLDRAPASSKAFVRGKTGHIPFLPGGLEDTLDITSKTNGLRDNKHLRTVPPGFSRGLRFPGEEVVEEDWLDLEEAELGPEHEIEPPVRIITTKQQLVHRQLGSLIFKMLRNPSQRNWQK